MTRAVELAARLYFELTYRLLDGSAAGRRILRLASGGGPAVHGYMTGEDLDALVRHLGRLDGRRVLDLGAGLGEVALEVHRRTGAAVTGVDVSRRAADAASRRIRLAGASGEVNVRQGSISDPPRVGASHAYALDSLMFVADPAAAVCRLADVLGPGASLFATVVIVGSDGGRRVRHWFEGPRLRLLAVDDVTPALVERSLARANLARAALRAGDGSLRGRAAGLLVFSEEWAVRRLAAKGAASRWRVIVRYG